MFAVRDHRFHVPGVDLGKLFDLTVFLFTVLRLISDNFLPLQLVHVGLIMKGTLAKRGHQCSSLGKEAAKAVADRDVMEKRLMEAEARLGQAVAEKATAESAEEASRAEADSQARRVSDLESEFTILKADLEAEVVAKEGLQAELAEMKVENAKGKMELKETIS